MVLLSASQLLVYNKGYLFWLRRVLPLWRAIVTFDNGF